MGWAGLLAIFFQDVARQFELFASDAIETVVFAFVDVSALFEFFKEALNTSHVTLGSRSDEIIVGNIEVLPEWFPGIFHQAIGPLLRRHFVCLGGAHDFLTMFIRTSEVPDRFPALAMPAGEHISGDRRIRMPQVRCIVYVIDRGSEIKGLRHGVKSSLPWKWQ
ncbi:MAG: hypothetical protein JW384_02784 [Nitrosomonadaceae bacterium]|nr:hypothetical protein [Nitrosomonadaceae bacterium]